MRPRIELRIDLDPRDLAVRLGTSPTRMARVIDRMVHDMALQVAERAKRLAPHQTGALKASIQAVRNGPGDWSVVAVGSQQRPYAAYMEFGTRPHWPPLSAIEKWILYRPRRFGLSRRSGSFERQVRSLAFVIARAIARRGTAPRAYMRTAFQEVAGRVAQIARAHASELLRAIKGGP